MLPFLVHKIFTFYTHSVLKFKCPTPGSKIKNEWSYTFAPSSGLDDAYRHFTFNVYVINANEWVGLNNGTISTVGYYSEI
jgi:hypothetical protein